MAKHKILAHVTFGCKACEENALTSTGAVKTDENRIYITFTCDNCCEVIPIEIENIVAELCSSQIVTGNMRMN